MRTAIMAAATVLLLSGSAWAQAAGGVGATSGAAGVTNGSGASGSNK